MCLYLLPAERSVRTNVGGIAFFSGFTANLVIFLVKTKEEPNISILSLTTEIENHRNDITGMKGK